MFDPHETLCIWCANSYTNGCPWAENLEPVDGWESEETKHGRKVTFCPMFLRDVFINTKNQEWIDRQYQKDIDNDGLIALLGAVLQQLREDYIEGKDKVKPGFGISRAEARRQNRQHIETRVKDPDFCGLFHIGNPDELIMFLRGELRKEIQKGTVV
jgi:hypothetical protein